MTASNISIVGESIPLASLPDIKIEQRKGEVLFRVTVTVDTTFSPTIIATCGMNATVIIKVGIMSFTGTVDGFGCRPSYSIVQVTGATVSCVP